jgi:hypothetical protein
LQTLLQPTAAEPYVVLALPVPNEHGEGDLRLYVRDEGGSPKVDPEDLRLVIDLRLSQLKRVTVMVHLLHGHLSCRMEAESLHAMRLLEGEAPALRQSLHDLGFAVEPIHCSVGGFSRGTQLTHSTLPIAKLGGFNVTA